jgi:hypothetical protein
MSDRERTKYRTDAEGRDKRPRSVTLDGAALKTMADALARQRHEKERDGERRDVQAVLSAIDPDAPQIGSAPIAHARNTLERAIRRHLARAADADAERDDDDESDDDDDEREEYDAMVRRMSGAPSNTTATDED